MSKKYMLSGFQTKPCTHFGVKHLAAEDNKPARKLFVDVAFAPGKITETDLDMSEVVKAGYITEVKTAKAAVIEPEKKFVAPKEAQGDNEKRDEPLTVEVGEMEATIDPGADGELGTDDDTVDVKQRTKKSKKRSKLSSLKS